VDNNNRSSAVLVSVDSDDGSADADDDVVDYLQQQRPRCQQPCDYRPTASLTTTHHHPTSPAPTNTPTASLTTTHHHPTSPAPTNTPTAATGAGDLLTVASSLSSRTDSAADGRGSSCCVSMATHRMPATLPLTTNKQQPQHSSMGLGLR